MGQDVDRRNLSQARSFYLGHSRLFSCREIEWKYFISQVIQQKYKSLLIISSSDDLLSQLRLVNKFRYREKIFNFAKYLEQVAINLDKKTQSRSQEIAFVFNFSPIILFISFRVVLFFICRPEFVFYFYFFLYFSFCKFTGLQYYKTTMLQYNSTTNLYYYNAI